MMIFQISLWKILIIVAMWKSKVFLSFIVFVHQFEFRYMNDD